MTVEAYSGLPLAAGGAVGRAAGRGLLWVAAVYMRDAARNTAVAALISLSVLAGGNALYKQSHHHPAPLFGSFDAAPASVVKPPKVLKPVMPADRPAKLDIDTAETTGSLAPLRSTPVAIGNDEVLALQKKLAALSFYSGTADGLFGPRTSKAIKAFEQSIGRPQRGLLTQDILDLVQAAALPVQPTSQPIVASLQSESTTVEPLTSLPAPSPLLVAPTAASQAASAESVQQAAAIAGRVTGVTTPIASASKVASLDAPADTTVSPVVPTSDPTAVPKRVVQTIPVHADTGQPMPSQLGASQQDDASTDPDTVAAVQRGLNSLGFLHGEIDGVAGEATAKAIRNFEVFYNYDVTGKVTLGLVELLKANGATI